MKGSPEMVETVFRSEYGKIMAILLSRFGTSHIEGIEDAVQDALLKAMQLWGYSEPPENPTAWLLRVAQNRLIDSLRRDQKSQQLDSFREWAGQDLPAEPELQEVISDSQLKMIFACCHPSISVDYQLILSLKLIGGFGNAEIARALLKKEATVAKSFTRAKKQLSRNIKTLDIPVELGLKSRLGNVLRVIYLFFSEGYAPAQGANLIKNEVCREAIRLAGLLTLNPYCKHPDVYALLALMCFHTSRFEARLDEREELVDLEHQDRSKYDRDLIGRGLQHLENASQGLDYPSRYHLEAAVSYFHCAAPSFGETDWKGILGLYQLQLQRQYSPVVALNMLVPYHRVYGAEKAMEALNELENNPNFNVSPLYFAYKAELFKDLCKFTKAASAIREAILLTGNAMEKKHLQKKLQVLNTGSIPS